MFSRTIRRIPFQRLHHIINADKLNLFFRIFNAKIKKY